MSSYIVELLSKKWGKTAQVSGFTRLNGMDHMSSCVPS